MIPDLDASTGHLPPGRYRATLTEVHARFVDHADFAGSATRGAIWDGFVAYMAAWREVEDTLADVLGGRPLVMSVWLGGSFISGKLDPHNVDLTMIIDGELAESCSGKQGMGKFAKLVRRDRMLELFLVSPCIVRYSYFRSPFPDQIGSTPFIEQYVRMRGAFDDWWQRVRPTGEPKGAPTKETAGARRGYLEVEP